MLYFRPTLYEVTGKKGLLLGFFLVIFLVLERGEQDYVGFWYKSLAKCYFDNISGLILWYCRLFLTTDDEVEITQPVA